MPGLLRGVARTAVVAGTATAVSNRVSRRQAGRWAEQETQYVQAPAPAPVAPVPVAPAPPPGPATASPTMDQKLEQLQQLAALKEQGILTDEELAAQKARILSG
ncbi:SHOCT domain-containing protein [Kitasatospora sp. NA04385]|uniref:SHOCT domain-containing protein n=1 Tax=Kitasatospora sp. NA04385 TaxID=2742135 RepID=UPI00158FB733|nr:SHOCT domain-containing protein [Kitasatospora sp. NA04385]QKW23646.1 SHOCT domain-containing protein [Kitasatospora sp. NA04385]